MKTFAAFALAIATATAPACAAAPRIVGIAFVDSSVTGMGSRAHLPPGATIVPAGGRVTGTMGCPTDQYGTTGLIVAVIDYDGRPTAGSLTITAHTAGGTFARAPYYLDINPGRTLQFLGPVRKNGTYDLKLSWGFGGVNQPDVTAHFTLARSCG